MTRIVPISPYTLEKILSDLGFQKIRQSGSHVFYKHSDGRSTTIPFHGNREVGPVLIKIILKEINITREEYQNHL